MEGMANMPESQPSLKAFLHYRKSDNHIFLPSQTLGDTTSNLMTGVYFDGPQFTSEWLPQSSTNYNSQRNRISWERARLPQGQEMCLPSAAWSLAASSRSAAANNLNSALKAGGRNVPRQGSAEWGLETLRREFQQLKASPPWAGERLSGSR